MSDWFRDQNPETTAGADPAPPASPIGSDAPASSEAPQERPVANDTGWSSASSSWSSPVPPAPPAPPVTPPAPPAPPTPPTPPVDNGTASGGWQANTPGGYPPPQPPYGWNPQPSPQKPPQKPKKSMTGVLIAVLAVVCVGCLVGSLFLLIGRDTGVPNAGGSSSGGSSASNDSANSNAPSIVTEEPEEEGLSSPDIVAANLDSTVIIKMYATSSLGGYFAPSTQEEAEAGEATGIVWTADGYIITNAHCVYNEETAQVYSRIEVELYDGTVFESAEVVGYDTTTDLAVIKVEATNLTPATFGDSNALQLGDRVLALGNNSGLGWTVTGGMVSGLARDVYEETNYAIKCLQVDAVINPGNSGGPLLNSSGQVVAINSAKIVAEGYEGLGFSIPINEASEILEDLVDHGYVKGRIMLGIEGYTFNRYSGYEGFYISAIGEKSSFSGTDARVGDIITHVNGVRVESYAEMREQLTSYAVGEQVTITLIRISRNNRTVETIDVTITLMESDGSV